MTVERPPSALAGLEIAESDVAYASPAGLELLARVYRPAVAGAEPVPALVAVHGGAWNVGSRTTGEAANRTLAAAGMVVVAIDFRQGPDHQHPSATSDIVAAVRWTKLHANNYGGDPTTVGILGNSSGGHLALHTAILPHADQHRRTPLVDTRDDESVDGSVHYVVANWPVSDPIYRFRYAQRVEREQLVTSHLAYFGDEATMRAASVPRILDDGEAQELPPLLVVQPGEDLNVPLEMTQSLVRAYQRRGGHLEYAFFPGEPHGFTTQPSDATEDCLALTADFIQRRTR